MKFVTLTVAVWYHTQVSYLRPDLVTEWCLLVYVYTSSFYLLHATGPL